MHLWNYYLRWNHNASIKSKIRHSPPSPLSNPQVFELLRMGLFQFQPPGLKFCSNNPIFCKYRKWLYICCNLQSRYVSKSTSLPFFPNKDQSQCSILILKILLELFQLCILILAVVALWVSLNGTIAFFIFLTFLHRKIQNLSSYVGKSNQKKIRQKANKILSKFANDSSARKHEGPSPDWFWHLIGWEGEAGTFDQSQGAV